MAQPLKYTPVAPPTDTPHDDLDRLLTTLHESGVLRTLDGLFGRLDAVSEVTLRQIDTPAGRNAVANLLILSQGLTDTDSDQMQTLVNGTEKALGAAGRSLKEDPPSLVSLLGKLRDPDVRRGLHAVLTLLGTLGAHLYEHLDVK